MHKILLATLLFIVLFFPNSNVFAQTALPKCINEVVDPKAVGRTDRRPPVCASKEAVCYIQFSSVFADCYRLAPAGTTGIPANKIGSKVIGIDCIKEPNKCAAGKGLLCRLSDGSRLDPGQSTGINPATGQPNATGIYTAIGCIPTEPKALVEGLLKYITLAAGGIAFLIMILASLEMITAEGNPESIKAGQEKFYSAIIGLLLIIFAVLLMQVIGVDILGLPGFNNPLPRGATT